MTASGNFLLLYLLFARGKHVNPSYTDQADTRSG